MRKLKEFDQRVILKIVEYLIPIDLFSNHISMCFELFFVFNNIVVINHKPYQTQVTVQVTLQVAWKPPHYVHSPDGPYATVCVPTSTNQNLQKVQLMWHSTTQKDG